MRIGDVFMKASEKRNLLDSAFVFKIISKKPWLKI